MVAAIRDAVAAVPRANPVAATPWTAPADGRVALGFAACGLFIAALAFPPGGGDPAALSVLPARDDQALLEPPTVELEEEDLAYSRDLVDELRRTAEETGDPELKKFVDNVDELLDKAEKGEISKEELLEKLAKNEQNYFEGMVLPDEIKVGAPFEVTAEIWSTHEEEVTVTLHQDDFPNGLEPRKKVALREGINRVKFKTEAKRAGFTTYRLRVADPKEDEEVANNQSVMTAPVRGRPRVLYVEGSVQRNRNSAAYLAKALERENIDVETRGPRGLPSTAKELQRYDLVIISDVPAHFVGMPGESDTPGPP